VELHQADGDDYENLHSAMESRGFKRTITADDGTIYHLPTAEYDRRGDSLTNEILLLSAEEAASSTGKRYSIIITESNGRRWTGLTKA
jgi:hypothetical protein